MPGSSRTGSPLSALRTDIQQSTPTLATVTADQVASLRNSPSYHSLWATSKEGKRSKAGYSSLTFQEGTRRSSTEHSVHHVPVKVPFPIWKVPLQDHYAKSKTSLEMALLHNYIPIKNIFRSSCYLFRGCSKHRGGRWDRRGQISGFFFFHYEDPVKILNTVKAVRAPKPLSK